MSRAIWKFVLDSHHVQHVPMPRGSRLLAVGAQGAEPVVWAECDDQGDYVGRKLTIVATGATPPRDDTYAGTFTLELQPRFVGHVYDGGEFTVEERLAA